MTERHIFTVWPAGHDGQPGGDWRQMKRWLVLDVTAGIDAAEIVAGPMSRTDALDHELKLRVRQQEASRGEG